MNRTNYQEEVRPVINYTKLFQVGPPPRPALKIRIPETNNVSGNENVWEVNTDTWGNMPIGNNYRNKSHKRYQNMRAFNKPQVQPQVQLRQPLGYVYNPRQPIEVLNSRKIKRTRNNRSNRGNRRNRRNNQTRRNNHVAINVRRSRKN